MPQIFISYRHVSPDQELAAGIEDHLTSVQIATFRDKGISIGSDWGDKIDRELSQSTHFIVILSPESAVSPMVREEVSRAYERMVKGETVILPVWIGDPRELPYAMAAWLNPLQHITWKPTETYAKVGEALVSAIREQQPLPLPALSGNEAEARKLLARSTGSQIANQLLLDQVQVELRPEMSELFRVATAPSQVNSILRPYESDVPPLPYAPRRKGCQNVQAELLEELHCKGALLLSGRVGLGKTREIAEMAQAMSESGWAVFIFETNETQFRLPKKVELVPGKKCLVIFDGIQNIGNDPTGERVCSWLQKMLDLFRSRLTAAEFRVVVSTRNEPQYREQVGLDPEHPFWADFSNRELAELLETDLESMLAWLLEIRQLQYEPHALPAMIVESDGTPGMLVDKVETAKKRGLALTAGVWNELRSTDWSEISSRIRVTPGTIETLWAILLLMEAHLPGSWNTVVDLARRLGGVDPSEALRKLIHNRVAAQTGGEIRLFGVGQTMKLLTDAQKPLPAISEMWPLVRETILASDGSGIASAKAMLQLAYACVRAGDLAAASKLASECMEQPGFAAQARYARGIFRFTAGDKGGAVEDLQHAIQSGYENADSYKLLGFAELGAGELGKALSSLEAAAKRDPGDALTRLALALAWWQFGEPSRAEAEAAAALTLDSRCTCAWIVRGCLRLELGDLSGAAEDLERANPEDAIPASIYLLRGVALRGSDPVRAESYLSRAIELGQRLPLAFAERGAARSRLQKYAEAEYDFSTALDALPSGYELRFARGVVRLLLKQWSAAEEDFTAAIEGGTQNREIYRQRGAARMNLNNFAGAETDLSLAIELTASGDEAEIAHLLSVRGDIRWRLGKKTQAMEDLRGAAKQSGPAAKGLWSLISHWTRNR